MSKQLRADIMLLGVTLCWGLSYLLVAVCLEDIQPMTLNAYRFLISFFIAVVLCFPKLKNVSKTTIKYSFIIGVVLCFVYIGATYGVKYTSISNAGFLCALTAVITPVLAFFIKKEKPGKKLIFVLVLCLVGIGMMTLNEQLKPAVGDLFCIMCAVAYAIDLMIADSAVHKEDVDAFQLGVFQLGTTGLYMLILSMILEEPSIPTSPKIWTSLLFLAIFCTGLAFIVQMVAQQYTSATHVGIIFALEPVFSGVAAFFFAGEILTLRAYMGAVILMVGIFVMEVDFKGIAKERREKSDKTKS